MLIGKRPAGTCAYMGGVYAVAEPFCWSWGQMVEFNARYVCTDNEYIHYDRAPISFHSWARNDLVDRMKGDWLFMLDTDHKFDPDILGRLLHRMNTYKLDIVCGIYHFKQPPHPPVLYGWQDKGFCVLGGWGNNAHVWEVAAAGAGCLLVKRSVFTRIITELKQRPFDVDGQAGEDLSFFDRCRKLGIKAFVDDRVECNHLVARGLSMSDYDRVNAELKPLPDSVAHIPDN